MTKQYHYFILKGADLRNANLSKVNLKGSIYDQYTKFPKGFNPMAHKMIYQST